MFETGELLIIFTFLILFMRPKDLVRLARTLGAAYREFRRAMEAPLTPPRRTEDSLQSLLEKLSEEEEAEKQA